MKNDVLKCEEFLRAPKDNPQRQYYFISACRSIVEERSRELQRPLTMFIDTFGCQMNFKDSEKLAGILKEIGYVDAGSEKADLCIMNTCTVRENANLKVFGRVGYLGSLKKKNKDMIIGLCGCMMQEAHVVEKLKKSYPFVDIVFGTHNIFVLAELLYRKLSGEKHVFDVWEGTKEIVEDLPSDYKYRFKAGVNIMFGCNNFCSYCIVPYVRGRERSRNPLDIVREIEEMASNGITEIMLLGQNVNSYGKTLDEPVTFAELLRMVAKVDGIKRIRFMTSHPKDLSDELIEVMATEPKICRHIHLPVQSGSSRILKLMNRKYTREDYLKLVGKIRDRLPDVALTTDIIVGFPGETEDDFNDTVSLVSEVGYDNAYTFIYSKRVGTPAASMPEQVPDEVVSARFKRLLEACTESTVKRADELCGKVMQVLVEEEDREKGLLTGRLSNNYLVHFEGDVSLLGSYRDVLLKESKGFYFIGELI